MDSCPGGGAEIFEKRVRDVICKNKITGEEWLAIARECHLQGVRTNATMLYGHVETIEDRVDHLLRLRDAAGRDGRVHGPDPARLPPGEHAARPPARRPRARLDLRVIAVSRLLLDNFAHIKAYWIQIGDEARADRAPLRRGRPRRDGRGRDDHARRRRDDGLRADAPRSSSGSSASPGASPSSATPTTAASCARDRAAGAGVRRRGEPATASRLRFLLAALRRRPPGASAPSSARNRGSPSSTATRSCR